jgi:dCMP deaminase
VTVRPTWDEYFLGIAEAVSARADCTRRQVGAVVVKDNRIRSTGYNGSPPGGPSCLAGECPRGLHSQVIVEHPENGYLAFGCRCGNDWPCPKAVDPGSSYDAGAGSCVASHAEANALLYAGRDQTLGATLYLTSAPCDGCERLVRAAGISRVIWPDGFTCYPLP